MTSPGKKPETGESGKMGALWNELRRRRTIRLITVYAATSFALLQAVDVVADPLGLPSWTLTFLIVLLSVGFVIAVIFSWIYDITPEGIKKTPPFRTGKSGKRVAAPETPFAWKAVSVASILVIIVLLGFNIGKGRAFGRMLPENSIAVLPFRNDSPNDTNAYFINGIMEEVLNHLQMVGDLRVISRTSVEQYRNTSKTIPEIAREQGVNYIVEGSGQKYGNSFRVNVQLIRAVGRESHIWAKSYVQRITSPEDIIEVQSGIAKAVVSELEAKMTPEEELLIEKVPTANLTAYDFYQRGRDELLKFWIDEDNKTALINAENLFKKALRSDPDFADAKVGLAGVFWNKSYTTDYVNEQYLDSVLLMVNSAISTDSRISDAYFVRGCYYGIKGLTGRAVEDFDRAVTFNPNSWMAYYGKALIFDFEDPLKCLENLFKSASINHDIFLPTIYRNIGGKLLVTGFRDESEAYFRKAFELDGDTAVWLSCLGGVEENQGNYTKALDHYMNAYRIKPTYTDVLFSLGMDYQFNRQDEQSLEFFRRLIATKKSLGTALSGERFRIGYAFWQNGFRKEGDLYFNQHIDYCNSVLKSGRPYSQIFWRYYELAGIYAFRGEREKAFENLRVINGTTNCELWMLTSIRHDPLFESIRDDQEFREIVSEMEVKYQSLHEMVLKWLKDQKI